MLPSLQPDGGLAFAFTSTHKLSTSMWLQGSRSKTHTLGESTTTSTPPRRRRPGIFRQKWQKKTIILWQKMMWDAAGFFCIHHSSWKLESWQSFATQPVTASSCWRGINAIGMADVIDMTNLCPWKCWKMKGKMCHVHSHENLHWNCWLLMLQLPTGRNMKMCY